MTRTVFHGLRETLDKQYDDPVIATLIHKLESVLPEPCESEWAISVPEPCSMLHNLIGSIAFALGYKFTFLFMDCEGNLALTSLPTELN
jgi:hypothetical protein